LSATEPSGEDAYRTESGHVVVIGGRTIRYTSVVERTIIEGSQEDSRASIVSTSYLVPGEPSRPVIFVFNGGPASASLWLHLGLVGPRRIDLDGSDGQGVHPSTVPPFRIVDNEESLLDVADIVVYDPPDTGYSRTLGGDAHAFHGVDADAKATVEFIQNWITRHHRWNSPRYLLGESYGSIRAAVVANLLAGGITTTGKLEAIPLNGVILLGQAMDQSLGDSDLTVATSLTAMASVAKYHGAVIGTEDIQQHVAQARRFVAEDYILALYAGAALDVDERNRIAERICALTGIPAAVVLENDLRMSAGEFARELLRGRGLHAGLYDGRYTLPRRSAGGDLVADDPAMGQYVPAFVAAANDYFFSELGVDIHLQYEIVNFSGVYQHWDFGDGPGAPANANYALQLAKAMRRNPSMKLFVGCGYYDLATPMGNAEYTISHAGIEMERVQFRYYESGHMPYLGVGSRRAVAGDLREFVCQCSSAG
jgi:carboxypeptidase C (cathepsin A)